MQFVHEDDVVELMVACLEPGKPGIFNVAGDGTVSYSEVGRLVGKRMVKLPDIMLRFVMGF